MNSLQLAKWNRWLGDANEDGSIANELANLAVIREIHSGLKLMVDSNQNLQKPNIFYAVIQTTYSQSVLMYIRRQVRKDDNSANLIMLAKDIRKNSTQFTKEFYSSLYTINKPEAEHEVWKKLGEDDFIKHFGGSLGDYLDPHIIEQDIQILDKIFDDSASFIDKRLAHLDKNEPAGIPINSEIELWCDALNEILRKYMLLFRAHYYQVVPILQDDWKSIFRSVWLEPSNSHKVQ